LESGFGPKASRFFLEGRPSIASDQISLAVPLVFCFGHCLSAG